MSVDVGNGSEDYSLILGIAFEGKGLSRTGLTVGKDGGVVAFDELANERVDLTIFVYAFLCRGRVVNHIDLHVLDIISRHLNDKLIALLVDRHYAGGLVGRLYLDSHPY